MNLSSQCSAEHYLPQVSDDPSLLEECLPACHAVSVRLHDTPKLPGQPLSLTEHADTSYSPGAAEDSCDSTYPALTSVNDAANERRLLPFADRYEDMHSQGNI
jgi:hypothetical protein